MKRRCMGREGYFFLVDSIIALGILAIGLFAVFSSYSGIPPIRESDILSEDIMDFFAGVKIKELNNEYAGIDGFLWQSGEINNADNTVLQQLALFYYQNKTGIAEKMIANLTINRIPPQYGFEFRIGNMVIYPLNQSQQHINSKNSSNAIIPSAKLVHGFADREAGELFGPYKAEAFVWRASG